MLWAGSLTRTAKNRNPNRVNDRGLPLSAPDLPYQSLRFASAIMTTIKPAPVQKVQFQVIADNFAVMLVRRQNNSDTSAV